MMLTLRIYGLEDIEFSEFSKVSLHVPERISRDVPVENAPLVLVTTLIAFKFHCDACTWSKDLQR
jgi:hypothetical protein